MIGLWNGRRAAGGIVRAARTGRVVAVEEGFSDSDHQDMYEKWVMVRHRDETVARYIHLTMNGALVAVGDSVRQGQIIGLSGNSGVFSRPHLHFDVKMCGPNLPRDTTTSRADRQCP